MEILFGFFVTLVTSLSLGYAIHRAITKGKAWYFMLDGNSETQPFLYLFCLTNLILAFAGSLLFLAIYGFALFAILT